MSRSNKTRFSVLQADLIYVGLRHLMINYAVLTNTGNSPGSHPDLLTVKFFNRRGLYNASHMGAVQQLWKQLLLNRGSEFRWQFDYIQVAVCALAVRTAIRLLRHGHVNPWADGLAERSKRLLGKLDALRKRIKRAITKIHGQQFFRELASSWRQFLTWLRLNLLTCGCLIRRPNPFYVARQRLIDEMCRVTKAELQKNKHRIPAEPIFRKLIRDALKNVRRFRSPWSMPLLRRNPQIAAWWFAEYIAKRMAAMSL